MSLTPEQQVKELFGKSESILILVPEYATGDAVSAALALAVFLEKLNKSVTVAGDHITANAKSLEFLGSPSTIVDTLSAPREFILSFNTKQNDITSIRTERTDTTYNIFITPERGSIDPRDFSFIPAKFAFDVIITIGAPDKDSFGKISDSNPDIFYEVPIINIDHHSENDRFGQVPFIDITASSSCEIVTRLLESFGVKYMDEKIAGLLLAGILFETDQFQKKNTTPVTLNTASRLMDLGANQHEILFRLFKSLPLPVMKLWGRAMAKLRWNNSVRLLWATLSLEDINQSYAQSQDIRLILEKIKNHSSDGEIFLIIFSDSHIHRVIAICDLADKLTTLSSQLHGSKVRGNTLEYSLSAPSLAEAETLLLHQMGIQEIHT